MSASPATLSPAAAGDPTACDILLLARERVCARIERAIEYPILVVCAPPGYGKSTVLREFFHARDRPYRRLTLTPKHGDLLGFLRAFANCLGDMIPALLTSFMGVYDRVNRRPEACHHIAAWAAGHLRPLDLALMVDGLEQVTDARIFSLLSELVEQTADARIRWIVVTRSGETVPLARWLANGWMDLPIDEVDLTITSADLEGALRRSGAPIACEALPVGALYYPATLTLALSDLPRLAEWAELLQRPSSFDEFAEHAFRARSPREQRFLLETCMYRNFDEELLRIAGWHDMTAILARLREAAAFVFVAADGQYHYHEIFRSFLERRLHGIDGLSHARASAAAAEVLRAVGRWSDALELYTELGAAGPLGRLLTERGFELMDRGEADVVYSALRALDESDYAEFPVALALKASLESLHGSFDVAEAWFRHAIAHVGDSSHCGEIVFRYATDLVRRDRRDAIDVLRPIVGQSGHKLSLAVSLAGLLATAYATHHLNEQAAEAIAGALERIDGVDDTAVRAKVYFQAGYVALFAGDPVRAKTFAQRALDTALDVHLYDIAARALSILYNIAMDHEDDLVATRTYLERLATCSIKAGSRSLLMYATLGLYELEVLCGNLIESARLDEALQALEVDYSVIATETLLPAQALRATWTGDFHRAYRLLAGTAEKQITPVRQAQRFAEIAVYAAAAGLKSEASAAVSRALVTLPKVAGVDRAVTFAQIYVALALTLLGRRARARQILGRLGPASDPQTRFDQLAAAIGAINERWTSGRYATELRAVLDRLEASAFGGIARLLEAIPLPETFRGHFGQLTPIERDVLVHVSAGLDAEQIARLSGSDPPDVEAHIVSLCRKLGCTSVRHAVALATSVNALQIVSAGIG